MNVPTLALATDGDLEDFGRRYTIRAGGIIPNTSGKTPNGHSQIQIMGITLVSNRHSIMDVMVQNKCKAKDWEELSKGDAIVKHSQVDEYELQ